MQKYIAEGEIRSHDYSCTHRVLWVLFCFLDDLYTLSSDPE